MSITYSYRPKPLTMLWAGGFFAALGAFYIHLAITNDRGLIINRIVELDAHGATVLYALLGALFILLVIFAAVATIYGQRKKPLLVLAEDHLIVPHGFIRKRPKIIHFADIRRITYQSANGQRFLTIWSSRGNVSIARSLLESEAVFEAVSTFIHDQTPHLSIG
jgi:hypothetical protein